MLTEFELTVAQFDAMTRIEELGGTQTWVTPHEIAEAMLVPRGNLTGVLRRLQQRSLIQIQTHPDDGRSVVCELTERGRALLSRAKVASANFIHQQLAPFSSASLEQTRRQMLEMMAHLKTLDPIHIGSTSSHTKVK